MVHDIPGGSYSSDWGHLKVLAFGSPSTAFHRVLYQDSEKQGKELSPWHDIPLYSSNGCVNFVCKTPKGWAAEYDVAQREPCTPLRLKCAPGGVPSQFSEGVPWNYGMLPRTWCDPDVDHEEYGGLYYASGPLEVLAIGSRVAKTGEIYAVKPLAAFALVDHSGLLSWKIVAIEANDPAALKLCNSQDVEKRMGPTLRRVQEWLRTCHCFKNGGVAYAFGLNDRPVGQQTVARIIAEGHASWQMFTDKHPPLEASSLAITRPARLSAYEDYWLRYTSPELLPQDHLRLPAATLKFLPAGKPLRIVTTDLLQEGDSPGSDGVWPEGAASSLSSRSSSQLATPDDAGGRHAKERAGASLGAAHIGEAQAEEFEATLVSRLEEAALDRKGQRVPHAFISPRGILESGWTNELGSRHMSETQASISPQARWQMQQNEDMWRRQQDEERWQQQHLRLLQDQMQQLQMLEEQYEIRKAAVASGVGRLWAPSSEHQPREQHKAGSPLRAISLGGRPLGNQADGSRGVPAEDLLLTWQRQLQDLPLPSALESDFPGVQPQLATAGRAVDQALRQSGDYHRASRRNSDRLHEMPRSRTGGLVNASSSSPLEREPPRRGRLMRSISAAEMRSEGEQQRRPPTERHLPGRNSKLPPSGSRATHPSGRGANGGNFCLQDTEELHQQFNSRLAETRMTLERLRMRIQDDAQPATARR